MLIISVETAKIVILPLILPIIPKLFPKIRLLIVSYRLFECLCSISLMVAASCGVGRKQATVARMILATVACSWIATGYIIV